MEDVRIEELEHDYPHFLVASAAELSDVLPLLRKREGFEGEITFLSTNRADVVAISLWDRKENAEAYGRDTYPQVLKILAKVVEGTPEVKAYEVSNSTFHQIAARS